MGVGAYAAWLQRLLEAVQDRLPGRGPVSRGTTLGRGRTVETPDSRVPGLDHHRHGRARAGQLSDDRHGTGPRDRPHGRASRIGSPFPRGAPSTPSGPETARAARAAGTPDPAPRRRLLDEGIEPPQLDALLHNKSGGNDAF